MPFLNCFLDTHEYALADVTAATRTPIQPTVNQPRGLRVSAVRLATAITKTQHSQPLRRGPLIWVTLEHMSALQRHMTASAPYTQGNLRLKAGYFDRTGLRDFSKTTKEGEYAQGLNFLFAQDVLKVPALVDYDHFCDEMKVPRLKANSSKPDFVGCENGQGYWLIESKGNLESSSVKTELKKGISQCELGADHLIAHSLPAPQKSYTTLVSFRNNYSALPTRICYVDPEYPDNGQPFETLQFLRSYYEKVIVALGFTGDVASIWANPERTFPRDQFEASGIVYYRIARNEDLFPNWFDEKPLVFRSGVSRNVIMALARGELETFYALIPRFSEQLDQLNRTLKEMDKDALSTWQGEEFFIDGTVVRCEMELDKFKDLMDWWQPPNRLR